MVYPDLRVVNSTEPFYVCETNMDSSHMARNTDARVCVENFDAVTSSGNKYIKTACKMSRSGDARRPRSTTAPGLGCNIKDSYSAWENVTFTMIDSALTTPYKSGTASSLHCLCNSQPYLPTILPLILNMSSLGLNGLYKTAH